MITIVSATLLEIEPLIAFLKEKFIEHKKWQFTRGEKQVNILLTGVGSYAMTYSLTKYLQINKEGLLINAGIAGAYDRSLQLGEVVQVVSDQITDLGTETKEENFIDAFDMELINPNQPPFTNRKILPLDEAAPFLKSVKSISSNTISGEIKSISKKQKAFKADIESMEGAAFAYVCKLEGVPFLQIRSISNYVEPRDKSNWDIGLAVKNLNEVLKEMVG